MLQCVCCGREVIGGLDTVGDIHTPKCLLCHLQGKQTKEELTEMEIRDNLINELRAILLLKDEIESAIIPLLKSMNYLKSEKKRMDDKAREVRKKLKAMDYIGPETFE